MECSGTSPFLQLYGQLLQRTRKSIQGRLIVPPMTAVEALLCHAEVFSDHRYNTYISITMYYYITQCGNLWNGKFQQARMAPGDVKLSLQQVLQSLFHLWYMSATLRSLLCTNKRRAKVLSAAFWQCHSCWWLLVSSPLKRSTMASIQPWIHSYTVKSKYSVNTWYSISKMRVYGWLVCTWVRFQNSILSLTKWLSLL